MLKKATIWTFLEPEVFITKTNMNKRLRKSILSSFIALHLQGDFLNQGKPPDIVFLVAPIVA
jgi:hypothetical protein